ncbi:MAG: DNA primase small subunit domain-containing protein [Candidatus Aenigmatarchaeota archaeon]
MFKFQILKYYSQPFVQQKISEFSKGREVVGRLEDDRYARRPDVILYPRDVSEKVKQGAVSFHCSVERWHNPMQLSSEMREPEMRELRSGWDFIIDIDAKAKLEHARIAAQSVISFLKDFGITPTIKFSGRRGFHIGVSGEAFPKKMDFLEVSKSYPEAPRAMAGFIREKISDRLMDSLVGMEGGVAALMKTADAKTLSPYEFIDIEKEWGNRHLFRMPYSLHEKTWLASVPLSEKQLKTFEPSQAKPESIKKFDSVFLKNKEGEASELLMQALEWQSKTVQPALVQKNDRKHSEIKAEIPEQFFPPCVKNILAGIGDGRKRSVFTLSAFLKYMNWTPEHIEKRVEEWNGKNPSSISNATIRSQLKWHLRQNRKIFPANCDSDLFYKSIGVCNPDNTCHGLKNPINYAFRMYRKQFKTADIAIKKDRKVLRRVRKKKEDKTNQITQS